MNEKQKLFADEYIKTLNGRESYKRAYKNCKSDNAIDVNASKLLRNTKVKAYIDKRLSEIKSHNIAEAEEVLSYLTKVMRGQTVEEVVMVEGIGNGESQAVKIEKIPSEKDRIKAAELLGKRYRLFTEKQEITGSVQVVFEGEDELEE